MICFRKTFCGRFAGQCDSPSDLWCGVIGELPEAVATQ